MSFLFSVKVCRHGLCFQVKVCKVCFLFSMNECRCVSVRIYEHWDEFSVLHEGMQVFVCLFVCLFALHEDMSVWFLFSVEVHSCCFITSGSVVSVQH